MVQYLVEIIEFLTCSERKNFTSFSMSFCCLQQAQVRSILFRFPLNYLSQSLMLYKDIEKGATIRKNGCLTLIYKGWVQSPS